MEIPENILVLDEIILLGRMYFLMVNTELLQPIGNPSTKLAFILEDQQRTITYTSKMAQKIILVLAVQQLSIQRYFPLSLTINIFSPLDRTICHPPCALAYANVQMHV